MAGEQSLVMLNKNEAEVELTMANGSNKFKQKCHERDKSMSMMERRTIYAWNSCDSWLLCFLNLLLICGTCQADSKQCIDGIMTLGRTWPQGDIILEHGQSLRIYCTLNEGFMGSEYRGKNSSDLVFFRNGKEVQPEYITAMNASTTMMYIAKPAPSNAMYKCKLRLNEGNSKSYKVVCQNHVFVGFKPLEPTKFNCVSQNWQNLTCTWEPALNFIKTDLSLHFELPGRGNGRFLYACPPPSRGVTLPPNTCLWDAATNPVYRLVYEYFTFLLHAENVLGKATFVYRFHHWANVIPSKPVNLSMVSNTYSSVLLYWRIPFPMAIFPPGLRYKVSYQRQGDSQETWETRDITTKLHDSEKYFNLTDLQYVNTVYKVRIYIKSALAIGEDKWSQPSEITIQTAATLPGSSPRTDIGSFEIAGSSSRKDVYVYWQTIPPHLENGDNFTYQIIRVEENGEKVNLQPNEITKTYAKFNGLSFNSFKFYIVAANSEGASEHKAMVYVPSELEITREPVAFRKIAFDNGLYKLSWDPSNNLDITNYTIFWCENDRDRPYQCSGYLDWVHVFRDTNVYNITVPDPMKIYQFAIAANTERVSSGMVWASCTVIYNKIVGKMRSVWINRIGSDSIEVGWELECSDRIDTIVGFNIYYCPIISQYNSTCQGPIMKTTVRAHSHTIQGTIHGLNPHTTYMLTVAALTESYEGRHSDPLYATTL